MTKVISLTEARRIGVDKGIRHFVVALNTQGLETAMTCAGHKDLEGRNRLSRGWISFARELDSSEQAQVLALAQQHGLKMLRIGQGCEGDILLTFSPRGERRDFCDLEDGELYDALDDIITSAERQAEWEDGRRKRLLELAPDALQSKSRRVKAQS